VVDLECPKGSAGFKATLSSFLPRRNAPSSSRETARARDEFMRWIPDEKSGRIHLEGRVRDSLPIRKVEHSLVDHERRRTVL
jgi:hypothetical protein